MYQKIPIEQLTTGMYVVEVTKQQGQVKITSEGFVKTDRLLQALRQKGVLEVLVDPSRSTVALPQTASEPALVAKPSKAALSQEMPKAIQLYQEAKQLQQKAFNDVLAGQSLNLAPFQACADGIIDSIFRNQDALLCVSQIREKDAYLLEHSVNVSILMTIFAKHLGFDLALIEQLATGALLHDIGKIKVPNTILHKPGKLTDLEFVEMRAHVIYSKEILETVPDFSPISLDVAAHHHERLDGRGYPNGLASEQISKHARMIAIVDTYDAITAQRVYKEGQTSLHALKILRKDAPSHFDLNLVNEFIQAVGIYPPGSLVRLTNQKVGIVLETGSEPTRPKIKTFYHAKFGRYTEVEDVDLSKTKQQEAIEGMVKAEELGIDLSRFFRQQLMP